MDFNHAKSILINLKPVKSMILKLKLTGDTSPKFPLVLTESEIRGLCQAVKLVFKSQKMLLKLKGPMKILSDINGQFEDLLLLLDIGGCPSTTSYLFLGNYVNNGTKSLETICLLFAYAICYPNNFWMLRGNHESPSMSHYSFKQECEQRASLSVYNLLQEVFEWMPVAAVIDDRVFACHGGASKHIQSLDDIINLPRPAPIEGEGLLVDLLGADPNTSIDYYCPNPDGISHMFGEKALGEFLEKIQCSLMVRGNQMKPDGYEILKNNEQKFIPLVTVFSAPSHSSPRSNEAAILNLAQSVCEIEFNFHIFHHMFYKARTYDTKFYKLTDVNRQISISTPPSNINLILAWTQLPTSTRASTRASSTSPTSTLASTPIPTPTLASTPIPTPTLASTPIPTPTLASTRITTSTLASTPAQNENWIYSKLVAFFNQIRDSF